VAPSLRLIVANGQPEPILPHEDIQGIRLVLASYVEETSIVYSGRKYNEEIQRRDSIENPVYPLHYSTVEASRTIIERSFSTLRPPRMPARDPILLLIHTGSISITCF
jgi:hypothetical protein